MKQDETARLVELIFQTWPEMRIAPEVWIRALGDLDLERARRAYEQLRDTESKPPSIAQLRLAAHSTTRARGADAHARTCLCSGRGWIEIEQVGARGNLYLAWTPCPNGPRVGFTEID